MSESPPQPQYVQQVVSPQVSSTGTIALVLEIVFALFGVMGVGNIYAKRVGLGIGLMIAWWVFLGVATAIIMATLGIAAVCLGPIGLAGPIISGIMVRSYVIQNNIELDSSDLLRTIAIGVGIIVFFCVAIFGISFAFGLLGAGLESLNY